MKNKTFSLPTREHIPESEFRERVSQIRRYMRNEGIDVLIIFGTFHSPAYLMYVANYWPFDTGGAITLPVEGSPTLFVSDNQKQPRNVSWIEDIEHMGYRNLSTSNMRDTIVDRIDTLDSVDSVGLVGASLVSRQLTESIENVFRNIKVVNSSDILQASMKIKSEREIALLRQAAEINDKVMMSTLDKNLVGEREIDIAANMDSQWVSYDAIPFNLSQQMITAGPVGGPNGNQWVTDRRVQTDDILTLDSHCIYMGYWNDLARSIAMPDTPKERMDLIALARETQESMVEVTESGIKAHEVYDKGEKLILESNMDVDYRIIHHPVGLPFIGNPWIGPDQPTGGENIGPDSQFELRSNMVYSIAVEVAKNDDRAFFESVIRITETDSELLTDMPLQPAVSN
jgi:Xaa-Pro aminopeptidase